MNLYESAKIFKKIWYYTKRNAVKNNLKMDYIKFLDEDDANEENIYGDETIDINIVKCDYITWYIVIFNFINSIIYMKNESNYTSYTIKRLLDNGKEWEYASYIDKKFILKYYNCKCEYHEMVKNDRQKEIIYYNSYQGEITINC